MDVESILEWFKNKSGAKVGHEITESQLYHSLQQFRPDKARGNERRNRAIDYLAAEQILERCTPARRPSVVRGKSPGRGFRVLSLS
jgi:hypothetical protein